MLWAVDHAYYMKLRMATAGTTNPPTPDITKENLADLFTKIFDSATFEGLRDQVLKPYIMNRMKTRQ